MSIKLRKSETVNEIALKETLSPFYLIGKNIMDSTINKENSTMSQNVFQIDYPLKEMNLPTSEMTSLHERSLFSRKRKTASFKKKSNHKMAILRFPRKKSKTIHLTNNITIINNITTTPNKQATRIATFPNKESSSPITAPRLKSSFRNCIDSTNKKSNLKLRTDVLHKKHKKTVKFEPSQIKKQCDYKKSFISEISASNSSLSDYSIKELVHSKKKSKEERKEKMKDFIDLSEKCQYNQKIGKFCGFCAFTFRNFKIINNDKLSIFINKTFENKIKVNFFALYHGIGGDKVSNLLKDHLHSSIFKNKKFLTCTEHSIYNAHYFMEKKCEEINKKSFEIKNVGSCSLILLSIGKFCI